MIVNVAAFQVSGATVSGKVGISSLGGGEGRGIGAGQGGGRGKRGFEGGGGGGGRGRGGEDEEGVHQRIRLAVFLASQQAPTVSAFLLLTATAAK